MYKYSIFYYSFFLHLSLLVFVFTQFFVSSFFLSVCLSFFSSDRSDGKVARWMCFNDARVSVANASSIAGPTAYVLFYKLREDS